MDGHSASLRGRLSCHCMLIELDGTLVLIDTGFGLRDVANPRSRLSGFFLTLLAPDFREQFTAIRQIEALGYDARDVRHIVLTHLDFGHAGVAVERTGGSWILQAGDAYFFHGEMELQRPHCTPGLRFYQWMMEQDRRSRLLNQQRLRDLKRHHGKAVRIMSSHEVAEFEGAAHRPITTLPGRPLRA